MIPKVIHYCSLAPIVRREQGVSMLLDDAETYRRMSEAVNPYGDGKACERIIESLAK